MKQTEDLTVEANKTYYVSTGNSVSIYDKETVDGMVENVNRRIDGAIEVYNGSVIPTTENQPYLS